MSRFFSARHSDLVPYTPGEQPRDIKYIKLNTNESPFPPSPRAQRYAAEAAAQMQLYPDPECRVLTEKVAALCGVDFEEVLLTNGSDEALNFAFMAFCDAEHPAAFPDITYGFYRVFAQLNNVPYEEIPLTEDYAIRAEDYIGLQKPIFIANPNAPTGIKLPVSEIERIVAGNPDCVVVVDEAYVDFGAESCIPLIRSYDNLLVVQTFSKSRSMAGARLGFAVGCRSLIQDLNTIKYSTNPYNINRMTMAAGIGVLEDEAYTRANCERIMKNREWTMAELQKLGFAVLESSANFVFARHPTLDGAQTYLKLRERGMLVRHFSQERLKAFNRITIGSRQEMEALIAALRAEVEAVK